MGSLFWKGILFFLWAAIAGSSQAQFVEFGGGLVYQKFHVPKEKEYMSNWGSRTFTNSQSRSFELRLNDWRVVGNGISAGLRWTTHSTHVQTDWMRRGYGTEEDLQIRNTIIDGDLLPLKLAFFRNRLVFRPGFHTQILLQSSISGIEIRTNYIHGKFDTTIYNNAHFLYESQPVINPGFTMLISCAIIQKKKWNLSVSGRVDWSPFSPFVYRAYLSRYGINLTSSFLFRSEERTKQLLALNKNKIEEKKTKKAERKDQRDRRINAKTNISSHNLEFGIGINTNQASGNSGFSKSWLGYGIGVRLWDWPKIPAFPGFTLNFQHSSYNMNVSDFSSNISSEFEGQTTRDILSFGFYPIKLMLFKKRLDLRWGGEMGFLLKQTISGFAHVRNHSSNYRFDGYVTHDYFNFSKKLHALMMFTASSPLIRKEKYDLRWRGTMALNLREFVYFNQPGASLRYQLELTLRTPLHDVLHLDSKHTVK